MRPTPPRILAGMPVPLALLLAAPSLLPTPVRAQDACPATAGPYVERGWTAYRAGEIPAAGVAFGAARDLCPDHPGARTGLGYVALRQGREGEARRLFEGVVADEADHVDALVGLGLVAWREGDLEEVARRFAAVREVDPDHPTAAEYLARIPEGLGPPPERPPLVLPDTLTYPARVTTDRFEVRTADGWEPFFVKGVNLGAALPGRHPSQFPDSATYAGWIADMAGMGANTVRVYTIHPPSFYGALRAHNVAHPDRPLWLVHGVWTELPEDDDFASATFEGGFFAEMRRVVDLIHGRADVPPRPGHASGHYTADVSDWTLAWIIGREWEPFSVVAFDELRRELRGWEGRYLTVRGGNAMDAWLGKAVEEIVAYETDTYREQRPAAYTNWPTLDPLHHPSESTVAEEVAIRRGRGETVEVAPREYDNDAIGLDAALVRPTGRYPAGYFASYHAYPYYPDFMIADGKYRSAASSLGPSNYFGYLRELKAHHGEMPVLVSEYGVPASLGSAHLQPQGWHHGGLDEEAMARADARLTLELAEAGMAGGILFAWIDEWFKKNWIVIEFEIPQERNRLWYNRLDAEQHYGMVAMEAPRPVEGATLARRLDGWRDVEPLYREADGTTVRAASDEAYLWLLVEEGADGGGAWRLGFDTVDPDRGDTRWPRREGGPLPVGVEFVLEAGADGVRLLADQPQNPFRLEPVGWPDTTGLAGRTMAVADPLPGLFHARKEQRFNRPHVSVANDDGRYDSLRVITNRRRFTRAGEEWLGTGYDRGILPEGGPPDGLWERTAPPVDAEGAAAEGPTGASDGAGVWEVRIPWMLVNFTDPSQRRLLQGPPGGGDLPDAPFGTVLVDGIRLVASVRKADGSWRALPASGRPGDVAAFTWPRWDEPDWVARRRPVFDAMRRTFEALDPWDADGLAEVPGLAREMGMAPTKGTGSGPTGIGRSSVVRPSLRAAWTREVAAPQEIPTVEEANEAWVEGEVDRAFDLYRRRLEAFPTEIRALHRLALMYAWREAYDTSLELFDRLLDVDPLNREAQVDRARVLAWRGDVDEALEALEEILDDEPGYRPALEARARFLSWAGRFDASLSTYDRLLGLAPGDPALRTARAGALTMASRFEASEAVYDSVLQRDPGDVEARLGLARVMAYTDRLEQARAEYLAVLRQDPGNLEALQGNARVLTWGGWLRAGEEAWREALARAPTDATSLVGLAQNLRWQGRNGAAREVLRRAERIAPTDGDVREQLRWVEAALSPTLAPSVILEDDSDDNRMLTTNVTAGWHPVPRFGLRVDAYERDLEGRGPEATVLERRALGLHLTGSLELGTGWMLSAGVGGSESDRDAAAGEDDQVLSWSGALQTPARYPWVGRLAARRSALDATALLAERAVVMEEATVSAYWTSRGGAWRLDLSAGRAWLEGTESNRRTQGSLGLSRRLGAGFTLATAARAFEYEKDLSDGYFDPDLYGIAELLTRWRWEPAHWSLRLEAAPGVQQVGEDGDARGAFRASARLAYRLRPGREISVSGGFSSTGLQSFSTGESDYRYTALVAGVSWVF